MALGDLKIENYDPYVKQNQGIFTALPIQTTSTISASNVTSITTNLSLSGTLAVSGASTLNATTLTTGDLTVTAGNIIVSANTKGLSFTGTGANGGVLTNLKNSANTTVSGTAKTVEISIAGVPYFFLVSPTSSA